MGALLAGLMDGGGGLPTLNSRQVWERDWTPAQGQEGWALWKGLQEVREFHGGGEAECFGDLAPWGSYLGTGPVAVGLRAVGLQGNGSGDSVGTWPMGI